VSSHGRFRKPKPPHHECYPAVLIRLEQIGRDQLAERIEDAWILRAPKRVVAEFLRDT
jgi:hypothetical protein